MQVFRQMGASVLDLHEVGKGCPDLLLGFGRLDVLVEVKDGEKSPSRRTLTPEQVKFIDEWKGRPVAVISTIDEAHELIMSLAREQYW